MAAEYDIGAAFAAIEDELISSMMRNLNRHRAEEDAEGYLWSQWQTEQLKALEDYKRRNQKKYGKQFRSINEKLEQALRAAYAQGGTEQETAILRAIRDGAQLWRPGGSLRSDFFRLNERKLEALIQATTGDMARAETAILRRTNDQYRKVIYNAQVYANTGAGTYEKAVDMATKDFLSAGIQCVVYQNGARHTLSDYADMALRTAAKRAYLQGEGAKRQEWGVSTVIINRRGGACPQCAKFCGRVFIDDVWSGGSREDGDYPLLSKAIEQGLYHPRCKDSHSTWFPELHEDEKPYTEKEIAQLEGRERQEQKEQNARRQAEKYRRLEQYSLDGENRQKYGTRAVEWEKAVENTGNPGIIESGKDLSRYLGKPIVQTDNQSVREWYVANVSDIPNQIDRSKPFEEQAIQAFELRNRYKHEARVAMSDVETARKLEERRPAPAFEALLESKRKRKGLSREEALEDILKTAAKTNADVNKEFGL